MLQSRASVAIALVATCLLLAGASPGNAANEPVVVGRVRVSEIATEASERYHAVETALHARFAPSAGSSFSDRRLISLRPREGDATRFDATIYDYTLGSGFALVLDASGSELGREQLAEQPDLDRTELQDAMTIVTSSSYWSEEIAAGTHQLYQAMPGITTDESGRRLINVGVSREKRDRVIRPEGSGAASAAGPDLVENEVVSVYLPTAEVIRYPSGAPETSAATLFACGPASAGCAGGAPGCSVGSCTSNYHVEWPAANPKWKMDVMHPSCTQSIQSQGTGIELLNVYYDGKLILQRAGMPVLNVLYQGNTCGPYRDWLYSEDSFQATGVDVAPGFRVTTGNAHPTTLCESSVDAGNFVGVAIHDEGNSFVLMTETNAGWYRYVMEWRFSMDGTIEPIFGFGATSNSCTCSVHFHQAYWRFEWALDGTSGNQATGITTVERQRTGTNDQWDPVASEGKFIRPVANPQLDAWRIKNQTTGLTYVVQPGATDGSAQGDAYAKGDYWALAYNTGEINDPNVDTSINVDPWVTGENLGTTKRTVLWYHASWTHDSSGGDHACELVGPKLVFQQPCAGTVTLDQSVFGCADTINLSLSDSDLVGAGTQAVTIQSTTESTPETTTLTENPASSGQFIGTYPTTSAPALSGDGQLSVGNGDTITIHYVDASRCGAPNVAVDKTTNVDCIPPAIANVQVSGVTESGATVTWTTNEPTNSRVTYGTSAPPATNQDDLVNYATPHSLSLANLSPCTTYYVSVTSSDPAGNTTTANAGGSYFAFTTKGLSFIAGPDNVESGPGVWTSAGTAGSLWHIDTCKALSGTHAWKAGAQQGTCPGSYGASVDTYLTSAVLNLGVPGHGYHLRFKEQYNTQSGSDLCRPQVSVDGGTNWADLATYSGSTTAQWLAKDYDLGAYTGPNVKLRFWFHSNDITQSEGWYLDDLAVSRVAACTADLKRQSISLADTCLGGGGGNANGVLEPGENAVLQFTATNAGLSLATGVSATLSTTTPGVTITDGAATLPDVPVGGAQTTAAPHFAFTVGTGVPCGSLVDLNVAMTADQGSWSDAVSILVGAGGASMTTYNATDVPKTILDNATVTSQLTVPGGGIVTDVNVGLSITHTYDGDLLLTAISPNNTRVTLSNRHGSGNDNYTGTVFDDEAITPISAGAAPYTGSFKPDAFLSGFDGGPAGGNWKLEVQDLATIDTGTLTAWSLRLAASTPPVCNACAVAPPAETLPLKWTVGSKTSLGWDPTLNAVWYTVYRGTEASLPSLASPALDSCRSWFGTGITTGGYLTQSPPAGSILWYLVTAGNAAGEGSPGAATAGVRILNSSGSCP